MARRRRERWQRGLLLRLPWLIPLFILVCGLVVRWFEPPFIRHVSDFSFDTLQRLEPRPYDPEYPVRIVDIDEASMQRFGQWPWPRTLMAEIVERLTTAGAAAVVFDTFFLEPDRTSPLSVVRLSPVIANDEELRQQLLRLPDHDALLARAIGNGNVVLGFPLDHAEHPKLPRRKAGMAHAGDDPRLALQQWKGGVPNLPMLEDAAAGNGVAMTDYRGDSIIRRVPLLFQVAGELYPSLAAEALRVVQGASTYIVKSAGASGEISLGASTGIVEVKVGDIQIPTDRNGNFLLYDSGSQPARFIPAVQLFGLAAEPDLVRDRIVLVGSSAAGLKDIRATPLNPSAPGVEVHAQLIEQALTGAFLEEPDWHKGAEMAYVLLLGLALIAVLNRSGALASAGAAALFIGAPPVISWLAFTRLGLLLDPVYPVTTLAAVFVAGNVFSFLRSEVERRQVRSAFSRYLAPELVRELAANPARLKLGGEQRELTVMFTDIRGFTTISESLDPQGLTRLLNRFLTPMTDIILSERGTIDKYMGDAIMAFWNAPLDDAEHAAHACRAALAMRARLEVLNREWAAEARGTGQHVEPLRIGIGLNSGPASVGNFGSARRFAYSAIGDTVNLASRLEGQTKTYGVDILVSEEVQRRAARFAALELDLIRVKGKREPARIFALLGDPDFAAGEGFQALREVQQRFLDAYRGRDFAAARARLNDCRVAAATLGWPGDYYVAMGYRLKTLAANPPPDGWDGVYEALTK